MSLVENFVFSIQISVVWGDKFQTAWLAPCRLEKMFCEEEFSMDDIFQKEYAEYLETTLKELVTLPAEGICILAKLQGGATYTSFHKSSITDKILYAGLIQQDAMIETLEKNRMIRGQEGDE